MVLEIDDSIPAVTVTIAVLFRKMATTSDASLRRFCSITGADEEVAQYCLEARNGNVDDAVRMFYAAGPLLSPPDAPPCARTPPQAV